MVQREDFHLPDEEKLQALLAGETDEATAAILHLAWRAGLTAAELSELEWKQVGGGALHIGERQVPLSAELSAFLKTMPRRGPFVVCSQRGRRAPITRVSVSRKARAALDGAGLSEICLNDLRYACILRFLRTYSLEETGRITGFELLTLQNIYRRYVQDAPLPPRTEKAADWDGEALERALNQEGDTLGGRVVRLSWQGNLGLREMAALHWGDVDSAKRIWTVDGTQRTIPAGLNKTLDAWRGQAEGAEFVLRGKRSGKSMEVAFLARRGSETLSRYGLEAVSLYYIKGKYGKPVGAELESLARAAVEEAGQMHPRELARQLDISREKAVRLLDGLAERGVLRRAAGDSLYYRADCPGPWAQMEELADSSRREGSVITGKTVTRHCGVAMSLARYYLNRAVERGLLVKTGRGTYRGAE